MKLNDLGRMHESIKPELEAAFARVLEHGEFVLGREVEAFENSWSTYLGANHSVACSNGTDALILALRALGIGAGDEVITTPLTFFATVEAIHSVGAKVRFVDTDPATGLMDIDRIEFQPNTRAVLPVHLYGQAVPMDRLLALTKAHTAFCVEDAAQAHGVRYQGKMLGTWGDAGCFSFYPGKNLGALGDAGAVVCQDQSLAKTMRELRDHGRTSKYEHRSFGGNQRMDGLQAAFLDVKLRHLPQWNEARCRIAKFYREALAGIVELPQATDQPLHLFVIRHTERDRLKADLAAQGIEAGIHYALPCHQLDAWKKYEPRSQSFPQAELWAKTCLSLPFHPFLTLEELEKVVRVIRKR